MSVWDNEGDWTTTAPDREDVAISVAAKVAVLAVITLLIVGLWAMTSPVTKTPTDATLGPPMGTGSITTTQTGG